MLLINFFKIHVNNHFLEKKFTFFMLHSILPDFNCIFSWKNKNYMYYPKTK